MKILQKKARIDFRQQVNNIVAYTICGITGDYGTVFANHRTNM